MSLINYEIPSQKFELIRDRIFEILEVELAKQFAETSNPIFNVKIFKNRGVNFDPSELPAISVDFSNFQHLQDFLDTTENDCFYDIIAVTNAKRKGNLRGYDISKTNTEKLIGVCRYILNSIFYRLLGYLPSEKMVNSRTVMSVQMGETKDEGDSLYTTASQLILKVRVNEDNGKLLPTEPTGSDTIIEEYTKVTVNNT